MTEVPNHVFLPWQFADRCMFCSQANSAMVHAQLLAPVPMDHVCDCVKLKARVAELQQAERVHRESARMFSNETARYQGRIEAALALYPDHADWCHAKGCPGPGFGHSYPRCAGTEADCNCEVGPLRRALTGVTPERCRIGHSEFGSCELLYRHEGPHSRIPGGATEANTWVESDCPCCGWTGPR